MGVGFPACIRARLRKADMEEAGAQEPSISVGLLDHMIGLLCHNLGLLKVSMDLEEAGAQESSISVGHLGHMIGLLCHKLGLFKNSIDLEEAGAQEPKELPNTVNANLPVVFGESDAHAPMYTPTHSLACI